jgi:signal transduction histidine kinase
MGGTGKERAIEQLAAGLRSMGLRDEPGTALGRVLASVGQALSARQLILLFYETEVEQLYRWDWKPDISKLAPSEVPPGQVDTWMILDRQEETKLLGADAPLSVHLGAESLVSVRLPCGPNCQRLIAVEPAQADARMLEGLRALAVELSPLMERFFTLRRIRSQAIDEERNRIAQDFHDGPLQAFLGFEVQIQFIRKLLDRDPPRAARELEGLQTLARNQGRELRDLLQEMRLIDLEGATLLGVLRHLIQDLEKSGDIHIKLLADSHHVEAPKGVCREVFHIVREAVTNARKHGTATQVLISVDSQPNELRLSIDDNGAGFHFSGSYSLEELNRLRIGPVSIKQRARQLGASLVLDSAPGRGARVLLRVPLAGAKAAGTVSGSR